MTITVNGEPVEVADGATVFDLIEQVYDGRRGVAVALAGEVVPRSTWSERALLPDDRVEVLTAVQGG